MFSSDWNKDHWSYYAYIGLNTYEQDLDAILRETKKLNYRDGDVYVELIDHTEGLRDFYHYLYDRNHYGHWEVLNLVFWNAVSERGNDHFHILKECFGSQYHQTAEEAKDEENYTVYGDWYEALGAAQPDLHQALEAAYALHNYNAQNHFNGESCTQLKDGRIVFTY